MIISGERWPVDLCPDSCTFAPYRRDALQVSPASESEKLVRRARTRWRATYSWALPDGAELDKLLGYLHGLEGYRGRVVIWDARPVRQGVLPPHWEQHATVTLGRPASYGARSVVLSGLAPNTAAVNAGQLIEIDKRIYAAEASANSDGNGNATVNVFPLLQAAAGKSAVVRLVNAGCIMRMASQSIDRSAQATNGLVSVTAEFEEPPDRTTPAAFFTDLGGWYVDAARNLLIKPEGSVALDPIVTLGRGSSATHYGADGLLKTVGNGVIRPQHNPMSGERLGWLIESGSTNEIPNSNSFGGAEWNLLNVTRNANAAISPDGTNNASFMSLDSGTAEHRIRRNTMTVNVGQIVGISFFVKQAGVRHLFVSLGSSWSFTTSRRVVIDLYTRSVVNGDSLADFTRVVPLPNGWMRVEISTIAEFGAAGSGVWDIYLNRSDDTVGESWLGNPEKGIYLYGAQEERGTCPTSYIATSGATASRSIDNLSVDVTSVALGIRGMSAVVDMALLSPDSSVTGATIVPSIFGATTGGNINALRGGIASSLVCFSTIVANGVSTSGPNTTGRFPLVTPGRIAVSFGTTTHVAATSGATATATITDFLRSVVDTFRPVQSPGAPAVIAGAGIVPIALSESELARLTT